MSTFHQPVETLLPEQCRGGGVTIGNFDGVHLGHQALLAETVRQARLCSGPAVAVTLDPHPQKLLKPESFQPVLTTLEHRAELLHRAGADHVVILQITPAFLGLSAREFFDQVLLERLAARAVIEGFNFGFGRNREGTTDTLQTFGKQAGIGVTLVPALEEEGRPVSTSRVRGELVAGNVAAASELLGRPYRIQGTVGVGQKRGRLLGFPTANLEFIATLLPGDGVYAARVWIRETESGDALPAAVNIGPNPTFGESARKVEAHLIDFQGDLYGKDLMVDFVDRIRGVRTFAGAAELVEQLHRDVDAARKMVT